MMFIRKAGLEGGQMVDGVPVITSQDFIILGRFHISRHLIEKCSCSFCQPRGVKSFEKLPPPGRFEIQVPPADNKWKWTSISWRWGAWQYYTKLDRQLFPSRPPYLKPGKWD